MKELTIFEREQLGEEITHDDKDYELIRKRIDDVQKILFELNNQYHEPTEIRHLFSQLINEKVDETFRIRLPFYTDFGMNIHIGKRVFINQGCTFMDRGGIILEDDVLIGPKVNLITISHPIEPEKRHATVSRKIIIKKNAWIATGATILSGVTVGENAVVAAGAVVTHDVLENTVVAGVPAQVIKVVGHEERIQKEIEQDCYIEG